MICAAVQKYGNICSKTIIYKVHRTTFKIHPIHIYAIYDETESSVLKVYDSTGIYCSQSFILIHTAYSISHNAIQFNIIILCDLFMYLRSRYIMRKRE